MEELIFMKLWHSSAIPLINIRVLLFYFSLTTVVSLVIMYNWYLGMYVAK